MIRYSRATFTAFAFNVLLLEFMTWVLMTATPWILLPIVALPVILIDALIAWWLTSRSGRIAQIGRGLAIGCLTPLLTLLIFVPAWIVSG